MRLHAWCLQTEDLSLTFLKIFNKSENECVNSANFCPVLVLLILCLGNRNHWDASTRNSPQKSAIIQGKKNHHLSKFSIFRWSRTHQELSFKKNSRKKCFFCANLWRAKVFSMLIILIDRWQVLSYFIRTPLLNQANNAIWQKSWSTSIVLTVLPWILEVNASKEEKRACPFSSLTPRRKKTRKSFCKVWASKLADSEKGSYYNQEKWLKDDKASEKPIETTAKSSFTSFLASGASFLGREAARRATNLQPVPRHIKIGLFWKSIVAGEQLQ